MKIKKFILSIFCVIILNSALFCSGENPIVVNLQAFAGNGTKVALVWTLPSENENKITNVVVYRTKSIITAYDQIKDVEPLVVLDGFSSQYIDSLPDYDDYFYTVILITDKGPVTLILLSFNSTVKPVHVKTTAKKNPEAKKSTDKTYTNGTIRETPLPYLDYLEDNKNESTLSDETLKKAKNLVSEKAAKKEQMSVYIFEQDLVSPDGGDDFILFDILKNTFIQKKYEDAIMQLKKLTGTKISENVQNRALFYLGESQYFSGYYEDSVKTFIKIENVYPALCNKWIAAGIDNIKID